MNTTLHNLENDVETLTGKSVKEIREKTISQFRAELEAKGAPFTFTSAFPLIGRGNVLRDRLVTHEEANKLLDEMLQ
jgi:hypothetical protein